MKYVCCCIYDRIAQIHGVPVFNNSKGSMVRSFADTINRPDENSQLYQHPDDFDLYYLGEYDDAHAEMTLVEKPELLARGASVKIRQQG